MNKYDIFFKKYEKEIKLFRKNTTVVDDIIYNNFYELDNFINESIALYESDDDNIISELNYAIDFLNGLDRCGTDDNLMGFSLRVAYFYCVGAIIEYLDFIRD